MEEFKARVMSNKQEVKALIQRGLWQEAKSVCVELCQSAPADAEAWFLLGAIHGQFMEFAEAEQCCRRVIALSPDLAVAHFNLGITLQKQGRVDDAARSLQQAILLNPNYAEAHNELGVALQLRGTDSDKLMECYRSALGLKPDFAEAHYNLATVLRGMAKTDDAVKHFREAVRLRPGMIKAHTALGHLLMETGNLDQAFAVYQEAINLHPDELDFLLQFGWLLISRRRSQEATKVFQRVLQLNPGNASAHAGMAKILDHEGKFEEGYALLRPFLGSDKTDVDVALVYAALSRNLGHQSQAAALLERALESRMPTEKCKAMHFALGKLYDEAKDYERAFVHWRSANDLAKEPCDLKANERQFADLKYVFSAENISRRPRATNKSRLPVFIVGMPRSGTSLVEQILASHPEIYGAGELGDISNLVSSLPAGLGGAPYPYCLDVIKKKQIDEMAAQHLVKLRQFSPQASRVTDKMPHNFMHLGVIDMLFPGAKVIHCKRNPVDTCLSIFSLMFNQRHSYAADLADLGAYYRQYQDLMAHWKQVLRVPFLEVQYEEIVANQEGMTRKMIEFCDLKWDERCLHFHESERVVATFSYDQVRRPIYKKSVARWKNYERFLGPLIAALGASTDDAENG